MMEARLILMAIVCLCIAQMAFATDQNYVFKNINEEQRYISIIKGLRCTICQNQSVFESSTSQAENLRDKVYTMFKAGATKEQIYAQMRLQYGDKILYMPPKRANTALLWFGPIIMLIGVILVTRRFLNPKDNRLTLDYAC